MSYILCGGNSSIWSACDMKTLHFLVHVHSSISILNRIPTSGSEHVVYLILRSRNWNFIPACVSISQRYLVSTAAATLFVYTVQSMPVYLSLSLYLYLCLSLSLSLSLSLCLFLSLSLSLSVPSNTARVVYRFN